jgi:hypothetical protein
MSWTEALYMIANESWHGQLYQSMREWAMRAKCLARLCPRLIDEEAVTELATKVTKFSEDLDEMLKLWADVLSQGPQHIW